MGQLNFEEFFLRSKNSIPPNKAFENELDFKIENCRKFAQHYQLILIFLFAGIVIKRLI